MIRKKEVINCRSFHGIDKIITGSLQGILRVYEPQQRNFQAEDLLVEEVLGAPIVSLAMGRLLSNDGWAVAVLQSHHVSVWTMRRGESATLERQWQAAVRGWECGSAPLGRGKEVVVVLSEDGVLQCVSAEGVFLQISLPGVLLPGPFGYLPSQDALLIGAPGLPLQCYKYSDLVASSDSATVKKQLHVEWEVALGDRVEELRVTSGEEEEVIVLTSRSLWILNKIGAVKHQHRLNGTGTALAVWKVGDAFHSAVSVDSGTTSRDNINNGDSGPIENGTLLFFGGQRLVWTAQPTEPPVAMAVTTLRNRPPMVAMVTVKGALLLCYCGTRPPARVMPVGESGASFAVMERELRQLHRHIRSFSTGVPAAPTISLSLESFVANEHETPEGLMLTITTVITSGEDLGQVTLSWSFAAPWEANPPSSVVTVGMERMELQTTLRLRRGAVPLSLTGSVRATGQRESQSFTVSAPVTLPWQSIVIPGSPRSDGNVYAVTLAAQEAVPLVDLFPEFGSGSFGFTFRGSEETGAVVAAKSGAKRYRLQASHLGALALLLVEVSRRLHKFGSVTVEEPPPLADVWVPLDQHAKLRLTLSDLRQTLEERAHQFRALQKRLLVRYKDKNAAPLQSLDLLLHGTHLQLQDLASSCENCERELAKAANALGGGILLVTTITRLQCSLDEKSARILESHLTWDVEGNDLTDQGWEEYVSSSLEHLIRNVIGVNTPNTIGADTTKLKKLIALLCDKISKGASLLPKAERKSQ